MYVVRDFGSGLAGRLGELRAVHGHRLPGLLGSLAVLIGLVVATRGVGRPH